MAPHFGHLIFASFEIPAHPKEKTAKITNAKKIFTHFLMTIYLLSSKETNAHYFDEFGLKP
jgi:abortive infection bacteriophage resistance protein